MEGKDWKTRAEDILSTLGLSNADADINFLSKQLHDACEEGYRRGKAFMKRVVEGAMEPY